MWRDEHTGLYHTHYRLYDPQHVRWLTPDPAGYRDGQNLYRFYAGPNGVDPLGLMDEDTVRHAVTSALATKGEVLSRLARIKAGDDEALTAEYIAKTQSMYKSYLVQRNLANSQIKAYMENSSSLATTPYDWYQAANTHLGEIDGLKRISAKNELADTKLTNEVIANNINTISTVQTTLKYTEYTCQAALLATGVGGATVWLVKGGSFAIGAYGYIHAGKIIAVKSARVAVPIAAKTVVVGVGATAVLAGVEAVSDPSNYLVVPVVEALVNMYPGSRAIQTHHLIPRAIYNKLKNHFPSKYWNDHAENLLDLPVPFHGNHPRYSKYVEEKIEDLIKSGKMNMQNLKKLQAELREEIEAIFKSGAKSLNEYYKNLGY